MRDLSDLPQVDWTKSIILSRTRGYRTPQHPYLVAGKFEGRGKVSLDTAIAIDNSRSMMNNNRLDAARKTGLAVSALMRKLNPDNETFLAKYSDRLDEISSAELMKLRISGATRTDLALKWGLEKLSGRGPSFFYLVTDGVPYPYSAEKNCYKIAEQYKQHSDIMLRVFLIDGNDNAKKIIRKIGKAAGESTKVIPVESRKLASGVMKELSESMNDMMDIMNF